MPVIVVTLVGYPTGLLPQPALGSGAWWLARVEWELVLAIVTVVLLSFLSWQRRLFASPMPTFSAPVRSGVAMVALYVGTAACALSLALISAGGFAPNGRPPVVALVLFAVGALLVTIRPRDVIAARSAGSPGRNAP
jgi:hypothetical protein